MSESFERRVEKLEQRLLPVRPGPVTAFFSIVVDASVGAPPFEEQEKKGVKGWEWEGHQFLRQPGEADEELKGRAIAGVLELMKQARRDPFACPVFHEVTAETETSSNIETPEGKKGKENER